LEGLDFFDKDLVGQDKILEKYHGGAEIVSGNLKIGEVSIHSSLTYHSSQANLDKKPRVGMVVHFCTDSAERIVIKGDNEHYLDQLKDPSITPIIYRE
jgi:ectoine hydroxylase-related dioxygenase (phytanoyl-CoA dioxygenase family)